MPTKNRLRLHPAWWTALLLATGLAVVLFTVASFSGWFRTWIPVTLKSERSGLIMEPGGKVKMRGLEVGRVGKVDAASGGASVELEIDPEYLRFIPANVSAEIDANTVFGSKYVDLVYPADPTPQRLKPGQTLYAGNVTSEVNTVFQNLVDLLDTVDPAKLNAILSASAEGLRGQGPAIGEATTAANIVLKALNLRSDTMRADWQSLEAFSDAYGAAVPDIMEMLNAFSTTAVTLDDHSSDLDSVLVNVTGFARSGVELVGASRDNFVRTVDALVPTTGVLAKYHPSLTCLLVGAQWFLDNGGRDYVGGNGYSIILDASLAWGQDPYRYPRNLPIVGARGGPGGKPGCGSLPDVTAQFPVRHLITNTGWGTGNDLRVNPGIGFPGWANYFPVTRAVPESPSIRNIGPSAPGPIPYPDAPPYGAQLYAPDGSPLFPGLPPAPPPGAPRDPGPTPGSEPFVPAAPAQVQPTPAPDPGPEQTPP